MSRKLLWLAIVATVLSLSACVAYAPYPYTVSPAPQDRFDRAWSNANAAMYDQGLTITSQDRNAGFIRGERGGQVITAQIQPQPDGSLQVKFNSSGAVNADPNLVNRVSESYARRAAM